MFQSPRDLINKLKTCTDCDTAIEGLREINRLISKGDANIKHTIIDDGLTEEIIRLCQRYKNISFREFALSILTWICHNDIQLKSKIHEHGGVKYLLSMLHNSGEDKEDVTGYTKNDTTRLHELVFSALKEFSNSSPILQSELWSLGLLPACIDALKMPKESCSGSHGDCCLADAKLSTALKEKAEKIVLHKELFGKFCELKNADDVGFVIPNSVQVDVYEAQLFEKTDSCYTPISNAFIASAVAWAKEGAQALSLGCDKEDTDEDSSEQEEEQMVIKSSFLVTSVAAANILIGYFGGASVQSKLKPMNNKLENEAKGSIPVKDYLSLEKNDPVCFPFVTGDEIEWRRGVIIDAPTDSARVFCLDYGDIEQIPLEMMHRLPDDIQKIPPLISICILKGLYPLPASRKAIVSASKILRNLCTGGHFIKVEIMNSRSLQVIINLCRLPWSGVVRNAVASLEALSTNVIIKNRIGELGILPILRGLVLSNTKDDKLMEVTLGLLNNLFVEGAANRRQGADLNVLCVLVFALKQAENPKLKDICSRAIKNLVGNQWDLLHPTDVRSVQEMTTKGHHSVKFDLSKTEARRTRSKTEMKSTPVYKALSLDDVVHAVATSYDSSSSISSDEDAPLGDAASYFGNVRAEVTNENRQMLINEVPERYTYQDFIPLLEGEHCEYRLEKSLKQTSTVALGQTICAILNSGHEGSIIFGVEENSRIVGINVGRDQRDKFRLGLDDLLQRLNPSAKYKAKAKFIPVMKRRQGRTGVSSQLEERFVVIIEVSEATGILYKWSSEYFVREGKGNVTLSIGKLRHRLNKELGKKYKEEIARLQRLIAERERIQTLGNWQTSPSISEDIR